MKSSHGLCVALVLSLSACGDPPRPGGQPAGDSTVPFDLGVVDQPVVSPDGGDVPVSARDVPLGMDSLPMGDVPGADRTGADTSSDMTADRPVTPGLCAFSFDQMAALAVRVGLCSFRPTQATLQEFFRPDSWEGGPLSLRSCPALYCVGDSRMGTCNDWMGGCLKYSVARVTGGTCPSPAATCDGRNAQSCRDGIQTRDDCQAVGQRCVASTTEVACVAAMGESCTAGAPPRCNGNVYEQCSLGTYTPVRDCTRTGATCDASSGGCRGAGATCTEGAAQCDGTLLRVCRGGRFHSLDCGRLVAGAVCQTVNTHAFCGVDTECDPTVAAPNGSCDGNTLVTCAGGRVYRYVCEVRNGFTRCETGMGCVP